jgi:phage FluMu gp28-like protein
MGDLLARLGRDRPGYTGHVVIDEAAWIPDIDALWQAIVPTISTRSKYRLSVVSTPGRGRECSIVRG